MLKRFRSLSQDDQVRLLAITDALTPAMLQDEMECKDEARLIDFKVCSEDK